MLSKTDVPLRPASAASERTHHLRPGRVRACRTRARECAASRARSSWPVASRSKRAPSASSSRSRSGPSLVRRATAAASASSPAAASVSARVQRRRVAGADGAGDPALRPAGCCRYRPHRTALASRSDAAAARPSATESAGHAGADHDDVGLADGSRCGRAHRPAPRPTASIRSTAGAPARRPPARPPPGAPSPRSECRILGSVIRFMCGQRLQGRTNSVLRELDRDVVGHRALGHHHDPRRALASHVPDHAGGRADVVGGLEHVGRALRMREDRARPGAACGNDADLVAAEALVHLAVALPQDDLRLRLRRDVLARGTRRAGRSPARHAAATRPPRPRWPRCSRRRTRPSPRPRC